MALTLKSLRAEVHKVRESYYEQIGLGKKILAFFQNKTVDDLIAEKMSDKEKIRERVYNNLAAAHQRLKKNTYPNTDPVVRYLESLTLQEEAGEFFSTTMYSDALESIVNRKMNEATYNEWKDKLIRNNAKCEVVGETLFNPYETKEPHNIFEVPAVVKKYKITEQGNFSGEGAAIGILSGHFIIGMLIGSAISNEEVKRYIAIESDPVNFNFFNSEGISNNGKELRNREKVTIKYREIYSGDGTSYLMPPAKDDIFSRILDRKKIELLEIKRKS